ncbi:N-acetylmuramoyl-L-alanine amidase [Clostridium ganghwense]|uniref:N-acetylmuramoyl-L-alanine amidase n=1 Tax=Clostridium ganghwense TaxID=312089 RepID=A0ABT4CP08_9CLOT|nr:N-acetylmuramoyl-L-alanine amidase [Clostridium ganghwense]MCY6370791.1 N-acetylmuramoyl-L-alanine amidase [Clostridium ganghwense]
MKIFIDPGHGGIDPGATANGLSEKDLVLDISLRQKQLFETLGHQVKMSRTTDRFVNLTVRTTEANKWGADIFISNHINAGGGVGIEVWHSIYEGKGKQYAINVEKNLSGIFKSRGIKSKEGRYGDYLYVIRASAMPAILNEFGFIDNIEDARKLNRADVRQKCAEAVVYGILGRKVLNNTSEQASKTVAKPIKSLSRILKYNTPMMRGQDIKLVQNRLNKLGYKAGIEDGILGRNTESAILLFQKVNGLVVDGIVGKNTWEKLMV